jgi:crotonobetainyl-CoA:carnitine CoA-transferase CaiB-like acyl-CoA transferase
VFEDPQIRHQQMRITIDHPTHGPLDVLGFPIKFTDDPCRIHRRRPTSAPTPTTSCASSGTRARRSRNSTPGARPDIH